jgi:tRNA pseudouridine38-40 synthase
MSSVRTITDIQVKRRGDLIEVEVEADGFLYNMVRAITGTLTLVGLGRWPESKIADVLAAEDRAQAGPTAPPQGLFLVRVRYD